MTKICSKCGIDKPLVAYNKKLDKLTSRCKVCLAEDQKIWRKGRGKNYQKSDKAVQWRKQYVESGAQYLQKKKYRATENYKTAQETYKLSSKGKETLRKYKLTDKYKKLVRKRNASPEAKIRAHKYAQSEKGKAKVKLYNQSDKAKLMRKAWSESEQGRLQRKVIARNRAHVKNITDDKTISTKSLAKLLKLQENKCYYCNCYLQYLQHKYVHLDHYIPLSKEGLHSIDNVVWSCARCNLIKSNNLPIQAYPKHLKQIKR